MSDFKLVVQSDQAVYRPGAQLKLTAYLEYLGESDVEMTYGQALISVNLNQSNKSSNYPQNYVDRKNTSILKKGDKIYEYIESIDLEKGKYDISASAVFTIDGYRHVLINTLPHTFRVK